MTMKVLLGATAALVLMAAPAFAQTTPALPTQCTFTAAPAIPDGANATNQQMTQARAALQAWTVTRQTEMDACAAAARALDDQAKAAAAAHTAAIAETNGAIQRFTQANEAYSARSSTGGRRERGSITN
jgi:hypothetical protein